MRTSLYLAALCAIALVTNLDAQIAEILEPKTVVFYASEAARSTALPSIALVHSRQGTPGDDGILLRPKFSDSEGKQHATLTIPPGTSLYGLGEVAGPLLRNGRTVTLWNTDAYKYDDRTPSLYQSHPWVMGVKSDGSSFGIIFDSTYRQTISLPPETGGELTAAIDGPSCPVIIWERATPQAVLAELAELTGKMPLPPKWALGFQQSRYSYFPDSKAIAIGREFREKKIPCDVLWFDIDYMAGFRIFTFEPRYFPDPSGTNAALHSMNFRTVWMIDPGIMSGDEESPLAAKAKSDEAESVKAARSEQLREFAAMRDTALQGGHFVLDVHQKPYQGKVWPGPCFFPDFTRAKTRAWWASLYKSFLGAGIDGVWNDMNEPSVFGVPTKTMPEDNWHRADIPLGGPGTHAQYHNVYGMLMVKATRDGMLSARPELRPFVLSRSNFLGGQRYAATWTGDNMATWQHLAWSIPMALNLGLSGQPFAGPDIGGYAGNGPNDPAPNDRSTHFTRWMGIATLLPFCRAHTEKGNVDKEPWSIGPEAEASCRRAIERRYRLLPYIYTLFREAAETGLPVVRPIFFADPSNLPLRGEDTSFLLGDSLMIGCRTTPDGTSSPLLPLRGWTRLNLPDETADPNLPDIYIKQGTIVPLGPIVQFVDEKELDPLTLAVCLDLNGEAEGTLYEDAGDGYGYLQGEYRLTTFKAKLRDGSVSISSTVKGSYPTLVRKIEILALPHDTHAHPPLESTRLP